MVFAHEHFDLNWQKDKYLFHNDSQMAQISASYISEEYNYIKDHMSDFIQYRRTVSPSQEWKVCRWVWLARNGSREGCGTNRTTWSRKVSRKIFVRPIHYNYGVAYRVVCKRMVQWYNLGKLVAWIFYTVVHVHNL